MTFTGAIRKTHLLPILLIAISSTTLLSFQLYNRQGFQQSTPSPTVYIKTGEGETTIWATTEGIMAIFGGIAAVIVSIGVAIGIALGKIPPDVGAKIILGIVGAAGVATVIAAKARKARSRRK